MKWFEKKEFRRLLLALFISASTCPWSSFTNRDSALRNICYFVVSCNLARQALVQSTMLTTCEVIEEVVYIIDSLYKYRTEIISATKSNKGNTDRPPCLNNLRTLISYFFLYLLIYLTKIIKIQESIPVGCGPPTCQPYLFWWLPLSVGTGWEWTPANFRSHVLGGWYPSLWTHSPPPPDIPNPILEYHPPEYPPSEQNDRYL